MLWCCSMVNIIHNDINSSMFVFEVRLSFFYMEVLVHTPSYQHSSGYRYNMYVLA